MRRSCWRRQVCVLGLLALLGLPDEQLPPEVLGSRGLLLVGATRVLAAHKQQEAEQEEERRREEEEEDEEDDDEEEDDEGGMDGGDEVRRASVSPALCGLLGLAPRRCVAAMRGALVWRALFSQEEDDGGDEYLKRLEKQAKALLGEGLGAGEDDRCAGRAGWRGAAAPAPLAARAPQASKRT